MERETKKKMREGKNGGPKSFYSHHARQTRREVKSCSLSIQESSNFLRTAPEIGDGAFPKVTACVNWSLAFSVQDRSYVYGDKSHKVTNDGNI